MSSFFFSRVSFVVVLACAAVVSFIVGPHAAKAYPNVAPSDGGMEPSLRSDKHYSLQSSEPGIVTGTRTETAQRWKVHNGDDAPSVIYVQPNLHGKGHLNSSPNLRHNQPHFEGMTQVHRGQNLGEVKPASGMFRINNNPFFQSQNGGASGFVAPHNGNAQPWLSPIIRKSSQQQRPLPQSVSSFQKVYDYEQIPRSGTSTFAKSRSEDGLDWQSPNFPDSSRSHGYWSSQRNSKVPNSNTKEAHAGTSKVQSTKPPSFVNQKFSLLSSASSSVHSSVINPKKLTSSITPQLSQGEFSPNSNGKTSYKRVQSYLLRNFHTTEAPKRVNINTQNSQQNVKRGQVFNQQARANFQSSTPMQNENKFGHVGDAMTYQRPASFIYKAPKQDTMTPREIPNSKTSAKDAESSLPHTGLAMKPYETVQPKESSTHPYRFQKYSFGQREAAYKKTASPESSSFQEYGSANNKIKNKSGVGRVEQKADSNPLAKLVTLRKLKSQSKLVNHGTTLTPFNSPYKQGKVKDMELKAVTYADIIGSASFSSYTPVKTDYFEKSKTSLQKEMVPQNQTVDVTDVMHETGKASESHRNATEDYSVGEKKLAFRKGEAETELGGSDLSMSEKESEAKSITQGLLSDCEENTERDSLLEMDYLRTSTGNISFQSLNLNL